MVTVIPTPARLGLPAQFTAWRPNQAEALRQMLNSRARIKALSAPTGFGKTLVYIAYALITKLPTCIVTESRGLQDQLMDVFGETGLVDIRGRRNYVCDMRPGWTCEEGHAARCAYKGTIACPSSQAEMRAATSWLVVTNYDKWTSAKKFGQGFDHFKQVIFDEAHKAHAALARAMQVTFSEREMDEIGVAFPTHPAAEDFVTWKGWAITSLPLAQEALKEAQSQLTGSYVKPTWIRQFVHLRNLTRRLAIIQSANPLNWVADEVKEGYQLDPIRPGRYVESSMLLRIPSVVFVSATLRPKSLYMIGIGKNHFSYQEFPSEFDPKRCPIYYVPTMRVDSRAKDLSPLWVRLDQVAARRQDRSGIVHSISYARQQQIAATSRFSNSMLLNARGEAATAIVDLYKASARGTILVSPSVGEGFDFPGCVYPNTKILTADLRYVEAVTLKTGDKLLAFDEEAPRGRRSRQWRESEVLSNGIGFKMCRKLILEDGTIIICSDDHPWLRYSHSRSARWKRTAKLRPFQDSIARLLNVWGTTDTWWAGYLSGIWDGEGHISQRLNAWRSGGDMPHMTLGMCQVENVVLQLTLRLLREHGFSIKTHRTFRREIHQQDKIQVLISNRADMLRFLGECRPRRILDKLNLSLLGSIRPSMPVMVVENKSIGIQEVSLLSTSTKTYVAEGFASHNTECEWQFLCKIPFPDGRSKIMQARQHDDPEYGPMLAMNSIEQNAGRGMRYAMDQCETIIGDMHLDWFLPRYSHLATKTFKARFHRAEVLPAPPPRL